MTGRLISRFVFTKNLIRGTTSNDVLELQKILSMPKDLQTGYFGWRTLGYVMLFQIRWGITPTGFVGPVTREKLNT
jgi:peptidoglycan hydrolase-like protein with peptidoglycan-binding domain